MRTFAIIASLAAVSGSAAAGNPLVVGPVAPISAPNISATIPALNPPATTPPPCTDLTEFLKTSCVLAFDGVQFYGTIDGGADYQTHSAPLSNYYTQGTNYLASRSSNKALWTFAPNGLGQSNLGIKGVEPIAGGVSFVFLGEFGFNPYALRFANGPQSLVEQNGVPLNLQTTAGDSGRAGQFYNSQAYAGLSSPTFGSLTFGRVNSITLDGVLAYDPQGASFAFSPIGFSSVASGGGISESARVNTGFKYHVEIGPYRLAALAQAGGYAQGNGSTSGYQLDAGGDFDIGPGKLSADVIYSEFDDDVAAASLSAAQDKRYPGTLAATLSNNQSEMLLAKYGVGPVRVYAGGEHIVFENPSRTNAEFRGVGGYQFDAPNITVTAYAIHRILDIVWGGLKYYVSPKVQITGAYYHYEQNSYNKVNCFNASSSSCAGQLNAESLVIDWQVIPKIDLYAGMMISQFDNGLSSGFLHRVNADPGIGARFRF